jgi:hypothetical protein
MVELEEIPEKIIYPRGEQYKISRIYDDFFLNIEEYLLYANPNFQPSDFEIKYFRFEGSNLKPDEEGLVCLRFRKEYDIAWVLCTPEKPDKYVYNFFRDLNF